MQTEANIIPPEFDDISEIKQPAKFDAIEKERIEEKGRVVSTNEFIKGEEERLRYRAVDYESSKKLN